MVPLSRSVLILLLWFRAQAVNGEGGERTVLRNGSKCHSLRSYWSEKENEYRQHLDFFFTKCSNEQLSPYNFLSTKLPLIGNSLFAHSFLFHSHYISVNLSFTRIVWRGIYFSLLPFFYQIRCCHSDQTLLNLTLYVWEREREERMHGRDKSYTGHQDKRMSVKEREREREK